MSVRRQYYRSQLRPRGVPWADKYNVISIFLDGIPQRVGLAGYVHCCVGASGCPCPASCCLPCVCQQSRNASAHFSNALIVGTLVSANMTADIDPQSCCVLLLPSLICLDLALLRYRQSPLAMLRSIDLAAVGSVSMHMTIYQLSTRA